MLLNSINIWAIFEAGSIVLEAVFTGIHLNWTFGLFFVQFFNSIELLPSIINHICVNNTTVEPACKVSVLSNEN